MLLGGGTFWLEVGAPRRVGRREGVREGVREREVGEREEIKVLLP